MGETVILGSLLQQEAMSPVVPTALGQQGSCVVLIFLSLLLPSARKSLCLVYVTYAWDACPSPPATLKRSRVTTLQC